MSYRLQGITGQQQGEMNARATQVSSVASAASTGLSGWAYNNNLKKP